MGDFYDTETYYFLSQARKIAGCCLLRVRTSHPEQLESLNSYFETIIRENPNWQFVKIYFDIGSAL